MSKQSEYDFDLVNHFTLLIYPFLHEVTGSQRDCRLKDLKQAWKPWWARLEHSQITAVLDDTYFFLPYIRSVLFPETARLHRVAAGPKGENWVRQVESWQTEDLFTFYSEMTPQSVIRLTYHRKPGDFLESLTIRPPMTGEAAPAEIAARAEWLDAILFPSGIGLLILKIGLTELEPKLFRLVDLNYYLRTVHPPKVGWMLPTLGLAGYKSELRVRDLIDYLLRGMVRDAAPLNLDLTEFADWLKRDECRRYTDSEAGQVYGERCQLVSYACIDLRQSPGRAAAGPFAGGEERILYEYATCTPPGASIEQAEWRPSEAQARKLIQQNQISVWDSWRAMALKESLVFLGTRDFRFNKDSLAHNIENDYLPLYIYTLYQKYQLFVFSNDLMREVASGQADRRRLKKLADRFVDFRNQYYFNEVTRKPMGDELYHQFQAALGVPRLHDAVSTEVDYVHQYYEERYREHIGTLLNFLTFIFLPLSAVIGIFGMTFYTGSWRRFVATCAVALAVSCGTWLWWQKALRKRKTAKSGKH